MKSKSPRMRHVSRTHRVALDRLFDRINSDTQIQIKYVDTKNQLADLLTKGCFTRDEWSNLLRLSNIMNFSMFSCSLFSFSWLGKPHVEENSRKEDQRRACGSKTEAYLFGFKKHMSVRQTSSLGSDALMSWGIRSWIQILFKEAPGNRCKVLKTILKGRGLWTDTLVTRHMFTRTVIAQLA